MLRNIFLGTFRKWYLAPEVSRSYYQQKPAKVTLNSEPSGTAAYHFKAICRTSTMIKLVHRATLDGITKAIKRLKKVMMEEKIRLSKRPNQSSLVQYCTHKLCHKSDLISMPIGRPPSWKLKKIPLRCWNSQLQRSRTWMQCQKKYRWADLWLVILSGNLIMSRFTL